MCAGAVIAILVIIIVWMVVWTILAIKFHNKTFEKLGLIGWLGHGAHQMVNGATYADLRVHHFTKLSNNNVAINEKQTGGMYREGIYDPDF